MGWMIVLGLTHFAAYQLGKRIAEARWTMERAGRIARGEDEHGGV